LMSTTMFSLTPRSATIQIGNLTPFFALTNLLMSTCHLVTTQQRSTISCIPTTVIPSRTSRTHRHESYLARTRLQRFTCMLISNLIKLRKLAPRRPWSLANLYQWSSLVVTSPMISALDSLKSNLLSKLKTLTS
jgi:hypothetical protein